MKQKLHKIKLIKLGSTGYGFYIKKSVFETLGVFDANVEYDLEVSVPVKSDSFKKESQAQDGTTPVLLDLVSASNLSQFCCSA